MPEPDSNGPTIRLAASPAAWQTKRRGANMRRFLMVASAALAIALIGAERLTVAGAASSPAGEASLAELLAVDCMDDAAMEVAQAAARLPQEGGVASDDWPPHAIGGVIPPLRSVSDPFPTFNGIALDTENDRVIFSDENRHSLLVYERTAGGSASEVTEPVQWVFGP